MADCLKPPDDRTLQRDVPELQNFLRPGMSVLDVGCGPGTITVDVAKVVNPGKVVGIDSDERQLQPAREWVTQLPDVKNVSLVVGDSHALDFPGRSFDIVYSHTVIHFFLDPEAALREQARVTKRGGWVIASGVRERVHSVRNPPCPNWDLLMDARRAYFQQKLDLFRKSGLNPTEYLKQQLAQNPSYVVYGDGHAGRKCTGWFIDAGLTDLQVSVKGERVQYHGSQYMQPSQWDCLPVEDPDSKHEKQTALLTATLVKDGLIDANTVKKARAERDAWYKDPHAFFLNILVLVAGRAP